MKKKTKKNPSQSSRTPGGFQSHSELNPKSSPGLRARLWSAPATPPSSLPRFPPPSPRPPQGFGASGPQYIPKPSLGLPPVSRAPHLSPCPLGVPTAPTLKVHAAAPPAPRHRAARSKRSAKTCVFMEQLTNGNFRTSSGIEMRRIN